MSFSAVPAVVGVLPARSPSLPSRRVAPFWLLQLSGWTAFVGATTVPWVGSYPLGPMLVTKSLVAGTGCVASLGLRTVYRRALARGDRRAAVLAGLVLAASYVAALAWTAAASWLVQLASSGAPARATLTLFDGTLYHSLVLLTWSVLYLGIRHHASLQLERERALAAEASAHQARLQALRYQLDPHFLFNTLNAISTFVVEQRTAEADRMIARLSDFLRLTLDGRDVAEIPLAEEVEYVRRYLEIEQVRFGDRLESAIDVEPAAWTVAVPSMLLQPLVENALRHAIGRREQGGRIVIEARRRGRALHLAVIDDGPGCDGDAPEGIGLRNTRERLQRMYGDAQAFELVPAEGGGTRARIVLPVRTP